MDRNNARSQSEWWVAGILTFRARSKLAGLGPMTAYLGRLGHARLPDKGSAYDIRGRRGRRSHRASLASDRGPSSLPAARRVPPRVMCRTGRPSLSRPPMNAARTVPRLCGRAPRRRCQRYSTGYHFSISQMGRLWSRAARIAADQTASEPCKTMTAGTEPSPGGPSVMPHPGNERLTTESDMR